MANIVYNYSDTTKSFEIKDIDEVKEAYNKWVEDNIHPEVVITDDDTYKGIYQERTALRKEIDKLKKDKSTIDDIILGNFETQCKELLEPLKALDEKLTNNLLAYKPKEPVYEFKIKTKNLDAYKKLIAYAETLGLIEKEN